MLPLPFHRRHLRRTALVMLVAWCFAWLAGVVNACQLQPHDASTRRGLHAEPALHVEHGHPDGHAGRDGATTDAGQAGCLKFCDDESSAVAKVETAHSDAAAAAIAASIAWPPALRTPAVAMRRSAERPASHGPPLVIRLLRLTI